MNYRRIYEKAWGPIPIDEDGRTYDIHHWDGDPTNNDPNNLWAFSIRDHFDVHAWRGDWGACAAIALRMGMPSEELSELLRLHALQRMADGSNVFADTGWQRSKARRQVEDRTNVFFKRSDGSSVSSDRVARGEHQFLGGAIQRGSALERVADGTHNLLGGEQQRALLREGRFQSQIEYACPCCGRTGRGNKFKGSHFEKCKRGNK